MKVNVEASLYDLDGEAMRDGDKPATLGRLAAAALTATFRDEENLSGDEKVKRFELAVRMIRSADGLPIELSPEDVVLAKRCIGKAFGPLHVGQAYKLLNGDPIKAEDEEAKAA